MDVYRPWRGEDFGFEYEDLRSFCFSGDRAKVQEHGYVLTPGRYVGAEEVEDDGLPFWEKMVRLVAQLAAQQARAATLDEEIRANLARLEWK